MDDDIFDLFDPDPVDNSQKPTKKEICVLITFAEETTPINVDLCEAKA